MAVGFLLLKHIADHACIVQGAGTTGPRADIIPKRRWHRHRQQLLLPLRCSALIRARQRGALTLPELCALQHAISICPVGVRHITCCGGHDPSADVACDVIDAVLDFYPIGCF